MSKWSRLALVSLALFAGLASQPWIQAQASEGTNSFSATGIDSIPGILPLALLSALCIVLVAYIKRNWSVGLLIVAMLATTMEIILCVPIATASDLSALASTVAKATGVLDWQSQQETVISNARNTLQAIAAPLLLALSLLFEIAVAATFFNRSKQDPGHKKSTTPIHTKDLWSETSK